VSRERSTRPPTLAPFGDPKDGAAPEKSYTLHTELQQSMNDLVRIIRNAHELAQAPGKLGELRARFANVEVRTRLTRS
jgi:succinate dehydrogenase / fumarate reductase flavoprotein subunit